MRNKQKKKQKKVKRENDKSKTALLTACLEMTQKIKFLFLGKAIEVVQCCFAVFLPMIF